MFVFFAVVGLLCIISYFYFFGVSNQPEHKCEVCPETQLIMNIPYDTLTKENVEAEIKRAKIKFPSIAYKQVMFETGYLRCTNCSLDKNNLFGFQRDSTGYLCFETWQASIYKYKAWQDRYWDSTKYKTYYDCLDAKWGADSLYTLHLKQF